MARGSDNESFSVQKRGRTKEARAWVRGLADKLGQGVDPGIAEPLAALYLLGYRTTASCQGHGTEGHSHPEGGLPYPWIDMEVSAKERERLEALIPTFHFVKKGSDKYPLNYSLVPREVRDITDPGAQGNWDERLEDLLLFAQKILNEQ